MFFKKQHTHCTDEELMQKVQQGSEIALTEIYQRYSAPLLRYFTRMLWHDAHAGQDFLQDLFFKVVERIWILNAFQKPVNVFQVGHFS